MVVWGMRKRGRVRRGVGPHPAHHAAVLVEDLLLTPVGWADISWHAVLRLGIVIGLHLSCNEAKAFFRRSLFGCGSSGCVGGCIDNSRSGSSSCCCCC